MAVLQAWLPGINAGSVASQSHQDWQSKHDVILTENAILNGTAEVPGALCGIDAPAMQAWQQLACAAPGHHGAAMQSTASTGQRMRCTSTWIRCSASKTRSSWSQVRAARRPAVTEWTAAAASECAPALTKAASCPASRPDSQAPRGVRVGQPALLPRFYGMLLCFHSL